MSRLCSLPALMLSLLLWGCTPGGPALRYWQDGKIVVYATDVDYDATTLGFDYGGAFLGLVSDPVTDVGSNATHVVARQGSGGGGPSAYFILTKCGGDEAPIVEGPLSKETFEQEVVARSLPPFTWNAKSKKPLGSPWGFICLGSIVALSTFSLAKYLKARQQRRSGA